MATINDNDDGLLDLLTLATNSTPDWLALFAVSTDGSLRQTFSNRADAEFADRLEGAESATKRRIETELARAVDEVARTGERRELEIGFETETYLVRNEPVFDDANRVRAVVRSASVISDLIRADWTEQLLAIANFTDTDLAIEQAFDIAADLLDLPVSVLAELRGDELVVRALRADRPLPTGMKVSPDFMNVLNNDRVMLFRDLQRVGASGPIVRILELRAMVAIPIEVDGTDWGILAFGDTEPRVERFPARTVPLLASLGSTLSRLIERDHARLKLVPIELLKASNRDLEQYAFAAAHDLRSPLRAMHSFSQLLVDETLGTPINVKRVTGYANRVMEGAARMDHLLLSMLDHAKVSHDDRSSFVELRQLIDGVVTDLHSVCVEIGATVVIDDLPAVEVDAARFSRVFRNLIENAVKYAHPDRPPEARISARLDGENVVVEIADNGIGIAAEHHERIFGLFRRLGDQVDGTGVGLAMVRRLVEEGGGTVSLMSTVGVGSTFDVTIPRSSESSARQITEL